MAVDKLVDSAQLDADLTTVANAIRTKGGTSGSLAFPAGFVSAIQAIPTGGGGSSWTKVCDKSYTRSTTSTTAATVETWATTHSEIWTPSKYVLVRVRDTAGKRNGYFYGCDCFFMNDAALGDSTTCTNMGGSCYYYASSDFGHRYIYNTTGYGIYADYIYSDGRIRIRERYHSTYSKTINGTYKVEVYLLDPPAPIFG